jgi:DNA-binding XRE family transcriptional regulator
MFYSDEWQLRQMLRERDEYRHRHWLPYPPPIIHDVFQHRDIYSRVTESALPPVSCPGPTRTAAAHGDAAGAGRVVASAPDDRPGWAETGIRYTFEPELRNVNENRRGVWCGAAQAGYEASLTPSLEPTPRPGDRVRKARKQLGWSQDQLAEKSGVSRRTISSLESCNRIPKRVNLLNAILGALNLRIAQ